LRKPVNMLSNENQKKYEHYRFPLLRNFVLIGLVSIAIVIILLSTLMHRVAVDNLIQVGENKNIALARVLSNQVWQQYASQLEVSKQQAVETIRNSTLYKQLLADINRHINGVAIIKVKIFDAEGLTLFSTDPGQLAEKKNDNPNIRRSLAGEVVTKLAFRDDIYASNELLTEKNILSSYVPLRKQVFDQSSPISGVIEIYSDVSELYKQTIRARNNVIVLMTLAMLLIFAVLLIFIRRAAKITGGHLHEKQKNEERMRYIAYHDSLTGLPNREMFRLRLESAMARAERNELLLAVLFMDLDKFKHINDSLGHNAGDQLLKEVAQRLLSCVRQTDTVARQGGDEFTIILDGITHVDEVEEVAKRILISMSEAFRISGREYISSASIGITIYPLDERDIEQLLKNADAAMYAAKESGRDSYAFYSAEMSRGNSERLKMEVQLRAALEANEYLLQYQPIVDLRKGSMAGVEALLRWNNQEYGIVSPAKFIPILEESGFITIVGDWVLQTACRKASDWQQQGFEPMTMSVNISIIQFRRLQFVDSVREALRLSGLDPQYLKLEITESILMDQSDASVQKLEAIRELGVSIAADDFGTGCSSLSYLKKLPIDILKIDRSFVMDVHKSSDSAAIVTAIAALAHSLKLGIVAEGVEQIEELNFLAALSCNYIQGFFFSKPLFEDDLLDVMRNRNYFLEKMEAARNHNQAATA
jgi:diguanylate cyclase (GGDEF)-like protein